MEEVRPILHDIFRCLLKRLDKAELRDRPGSRQGKTCLVFHISDSCDAAPAALVAFVESLHKAHRYAALVHNQVHIAVGFIALKSKMVSVLSPKSGQSFLSSCAQLRRGATNRIVRGWILILDSHRLSEIETSLNIFRFYREEALERNAAENLTSARGRNTEPSPDLADAASRALPSRIQASSRKSRELSRSLLFAGARSRSDASADTAIRIRCSNPFLRYPGYP